MGESKRRDRKQEFLDDETPAIDAAYHWLQTRRIYSVARADVRELVRAILSSGKKLSRAAATADEVLPGEHGPAQTAIHMNSLLHALKDLYPGFDVTVFLGEKPEHAPQGVLPRFNYGSTGDRRDMVATLKAFIEKNESQWEKLEKIKDEPPTGSVS